ncbi:MAG TPA: hypothetical protein PKC73_01250 [Dermatophilaceae bacterium]|nr:hypothetical protein [Candidatus Brachybacter algidus]MBK8748776.1 HK97 gp10 family phage protein [Candidatus Brachybacter algidus]HMT88236.1 hypothetical protein [Dermatophilaceae bacterium]HOA03419.1 hypothetical protein [Dermatophilaceae bacterium]
MDVSFTSRGSFNKTESFLRNAPKQNVRAVLESCGQAGVRALSAATPRASGIAAESWYCEVIQTRSGWTIAWSNSNIENGFPVAVMLQYGHGTGTGGWVEGKDYINPALKPIFDQIADKAWKAVTSA